MARGFRSVDEAIARFDEYSARLDGHTPALPSARRRHFTRSAASFGRRIANIGMAIGALIVAAMAWGIFIDPIGWGGLFLVVVATIFILIFFSVVGGEKAEKPFKEGMPNKEVVRTLDAFLHRRRSNLPAAAAMRVDAIAQRLPLLETRLSEVNELDPVAQDARRLMGRHLPELIERYQRVPPAYRHERDGEGMTVDERLVTSLDAAREALDDIASKLTREDLNAFETQGRFIESRYKDGATLKDE